MTPPSQSAMPSKRTNEHGYSTAGTTLPSSPSARVRRFVYQREQDSCWLCGLIGVCVAPIIAQTDAALFEAYRKQGVLTMLDPLQDANNLMLLCRGCSTGFNQRVPIWVFLPSDLDAFIAEELEFQVTRNACAQRGWQVERTSEAGNEILYTRYLVREGHIRDTPFLESPQKTWSGDPVAAIIRSQSVISGIQPLAVSAGGIPAATAQKLARLLMLYSSTPPVVQEEESSSEESSDGSSSPSSDDDDMSTDGDVVSGSEATEEDASEEDLGDIQARCGVLASLLHDDDNAAVPKTWAGLNARLADLQYRWNIVEQAMVRLGIPLPESVQQVILQ